MNEKLIEVTNHGIFIPLSELEKKYLLMILKDQLGNQTSTAKIIGLTRRTIYRKMKQIKGEMK